MPIEKINLLRNYGIFREFRWPIELPPLSNYNLIYGHNWSGKSTITNILRSVERGTGNHLGEFRITIDGNVVTSSINSISAHNLKVFNKSFIDDSVFPAASEEISGIFNIGEENVAIAKQIELLQIELKQKEEAIAEKRTSLTREQAKRDDRGTKQARLIREAFLAFGLSGYNLYQRPKLFEDLDLIVEQHDAIIPPTEPELQSYRSILSTERLSTIDLVPQNQFSVNDLIGSTSSLIRKTPVAMFSARITNDPTVGEWIALGYKLHQGRAETQCLYCDQSIPHNVVAELKSHFNTEVERLIAGIDAEIDQIKKTIGDIETFKLPDEIRIYADLRHRYTIAESAFETERNTTVSTLSALVDLLNSKKSRVDAAMTTDGIAIRTAPVSITKLNNIIANHNELTRDFDTKRKQAETQIKTSYLIEYIEDYEDSNRNIKRLNTEIASFRTKISSIQKNITDLKLKIDNYSLAAANLTTDLREYLGHGDLQISVRNDSYVITRFGVAASNLSEGEKSAVALLYFLHSLSADGIDSSQIVVVLDDPVTSMDTNSMINAVSFIRNRIPEVGQITVLTHDYNFTKEVIKWFRAESKPVERNFYMMQVTHAGDYRNSSIIELDPKLVRFDSEYHYMFDQVRKCAQQRQQNQMFTHHHMPNLLRRVIETFVAFKFPSAINTTTKFRRLRKSGFSEPKIDAIESFTNSFSHGLDAGGQEPDPLTLPSTPQFAQDVLDLIKHIDPDHFNDMCDAIANADRDRQNH